MTNDERAAAEKELGHKLPDVFVDYMTQHRERLLSIESLRIKELVAGGVCVTGPDLVSCKAGADAAAECVSEMLEECPDMLDWRNSFFIVGDDGGGGYYFMKRDGSPEIWLMDSDWYEEPDIEAPSLDAWITDWLADA